MKYRPNSVALFAFTLLLGSNLAIAADKTKATAPQPVASQAMTSPKDTAVKLVDINSASKAELKKLPGITDADAAKIIAGRPYGSKAQLVSHDIISNAAYQNLKALIVAKQSSTGSASGAAPHTVKK